MAKKNSSARKFFGSQKFIVLLVFIVLYVIFRSVSSEFGRYTTLVSMFDFSYYIVLMAFGVALALITGGVDLSIGTGIVCYSIIGAALIKNHNVPVAVAMLVSILVGTAIGLLNGILIAIMDLPPFLATLCTCMIVRGLGSICANNFAIPWPTLQQEGGWFHKIFKIKLESGVAIPVGFIWIFALMFVMMYVLNHTKFGRYVIAIGSNKEATILSGVNVKFYHTMAYVICGLFAGVASIAYAAATPTIQPGVGAGVEMDAIGGAIVGGVSASGGSGSMEGTFIGAYVIMILKTGLPFVGLNANWQQIITGLVLIGAVMIDIVKRRRSAAMLGVAA